MEKGKRISFFKNFDEQEEYHLRQTAFMSVLDRIKLATELSKMFSPDLWKDDFVPDKVIRFRPLDEY